MVCDPDRTLRSSCGSAVHFLERARALARELPAHRAAHEAARQLAPEVVAALREARLLDCLVPAELGGGELAPAAYVEVLEALAIGDAATAWCVMTASTSTLLAGYLPRETAAAIWQGAPFCAGIFAPGGQRAADGTLRGRWSYASGSRHADWFAVGAIAGGRHVVCLVPAAAVQVADNWDPLGLAGTGSHDIAIDGAVVADAYTTSVFDAAPWPAGALYRVPLFGLLAAGIAGCALGIARGALDHVGGALTGEAPAAVLARYAALRAELDASRAYLLATCAAALPEVAGVADAAARDATRGALRLAAGHVAARCAEVVGGAFQLAGGAAARRESVLAAAMRDIETLCTHRMVQDRVRPATARALLGLGNLPADL